jgi:hypothetical protein
MNWWMFLPLLPFPLFLATVWMGLAMRGEPMPEPDSMLFDAIYTFCLKLATPQGAWMTWLCQWLPMGVAGLAAYLAPSLLLYVAAVGLRCLRRPT